MSGTARGFPRPLRAANGMKYFQKLWIFRIISDSTEFRMDEIPIKSKDQSLNSQYIEVKFRQNFLA